MLEDQETELEGTDDRTTLKLVALGIFVMQALIVWNQFRLTSDQERVNTKVVKFTDQITCFVVQSFAMNDPARPASTPAGPSILTTCEFVEPRPK